MSKAALAQIIQSETGSTAKAAKAAIDSIVQSIAKAIKKEGEFAIAGFGTFRLSKRAARKGRNPQTGEAIKIKASKGVRFKASKTLKDTL